MAPSTPKRFAPGAHSCVLALITLTALAAAPVAHAEGVEFLHDTSLLIDGQLTAGSQATFWVGVHKAPDLLTQVPLAGAEVSAQLFKEDAPLGAPTLARTGPDGSAVVRFVAPRAGNYRLVIETRSEHGADRIERALVVHERKLVHLATDRTLYEPGQSIHWRTTTLNAADAHPIAGDALAVELRDPRGTLLWREAGKSDAHGMASGAIPMSEANAFGDYEIKVSAGAVVTTHKLKLQRATLPRVLVTFEDVRGPSAEGRVTGIVAARYPYGEPVHGTIELTLTARRPVVVEGALDANGRFAFDATLAEPERLQGMDVRVRAIVTDGSKRPQEAVHTIVGQRPARLGVAVVAARRSAQPHEVVAFTVLTSDGRGELVPAALNLRAVAGTLATTQVASDGAARLEATADGNGVLRIEVEAVRGADTDRAALSLVRARGEDVAITVAEPVVAPGAPVRLSGRWGGKGTRGAVLVTLVRNDAPLAATLGARDGDVLTAELAPPPGVFGLCTVRAAELRLSADGAVNVVRSEALVYLAPTTLDVQVENDTRHRPGKTASVGVRVLDAAGRPVANAGIAASVVDERALALSQERPDIVAVLGALDQVPVRELDRRGENAGLAFARLLASREPAARLAARATLEAMTPRDQPPAAMSEAGPRLRDERTRASKAFEAALTALDAGDASAFVRADASAPWTPRAEVSTLLAEAKWAEEERLTPWAKATTWAYIAALEPVRTFALVGDRLVRKRLDALADALEKAKARAAYYRGPATIVQHLADRGVIAARLVNDPWGRPIVASVERRPDPGRGNRLVRCAVLTSLGPDGIEGNKDDVEVVDVFGDHRQDVHWYRLGHGASGMGYSGDGAGGGGDGVGRIAVGARDGLVAVRRRFDETVLWVTGLATDARGERVLEVPLADSITGWKMKVEAVAPDGAVGATTTRLETFLPLHATAEPPRALVAGDRYVMPVVVANHSGQAQTLGLVATASGSLAIDNPGGRIALADGATASLNVPLVATQAGLGKYRVALVAYDAAGEETTVDVFERELPVEPVGALVRTATPARVQGGSARFEIEVPREAAPDTAKARLQVYRDLSDISLDGLEGMLKEPHGCFEQTSSTTHPNLLVLDLLQRRPGFEAAVDKAREYVAKGYQRLVRYEVTGGGFSLFGNAPASTKLSAYGLVEFTDMAKVYPVDPELITRTRKWLVAQQRADGAFGADAEVGEDAARLALTAYVAWALAEAGEHGAPLDKALDHLARRRTQVTDPYVLALWATAEALARRTPVAGPLLRAHRVAGDDGIAFNTAPEGETLMYARGRGATVQTTALAAMALSHLGAPNDATRAMDWLWQARSERGGWGSTQGTMLALRAASVVYDVREPRPLPARLAVSVDGQPAGMVDMTVKRGVPQLELALSPGAHEIVLTAPNLDGLRADLALTWRGAQAPRATDAGLVVTIAGDEATFVGETLTQEVSLINPKPEAVSMPTLVVPVPPGFRADADAVRRLQQRADIARVEDVGGEVHIYLTTIEGGATLTFDVGLEALVECAVTQRPTSAFAYYDAATRGTTSARRLSALPRR